ncbi:MAG: RNA polymerase sigma factor [Planctomycetota bacterium]|jgi:RNA polymerase sigma factor (sigma-70 family)
MHDLSTHVSLLSRVRDPSDHAAWRQFDHRYRELILRYCRGRGLQQADAEDVRQMVMINLARHLKDFRYRPELGRFRGYLQRTVRNAIHRYFRSPRREIHGLEQGEDLACTDQDSSEIDSLWESEWRQHHYRLAMVAVRRMTKAEGVEVFEALLSGLSVEDVASRFEMSTSAVQKVKQRVRDRLRTQIALQVTEEDGLDRNGAA